MEVPYWIGPAVALFGALFSGCFALLAFVHTRRVQAAEVHRDISAQYDRLIQFRASHPELLPISRSWTHDNLTRAYSTPSAENRVFGLYYIYVELILGFCNVVLHAKARGLVDRSTFQEHYKPLLRLLLAEHYPAVSGLAAHGPYVSDWIRRFLQEGADQGWNWRQEHADLIPVAPNE